MIKLDCLQLLSGEPINIEGLGMFRSPTIKNISEIGEDTYYKYLSAIYTLKNAKDDEAIHSIMNTEECEDALRFFVVFDVDNIDLKSETLYEDTIESSCDLILQINYMNQDVRPKAKPKNKRAAEIMEKIEKANLDLANHNRSESISIGELVSSICSMKPAYSYSDVFTLTIYQLYDLFFGLQVALNYDISSTRFAAWGGEDFDPNSWMKRKQKQGV